jgi:hypothetical protein
MTKSLLIVLMRTRKASAVKVQKILTDFGCNIKTRLGIHDGVLNKCSDVGLIVLELVGTKKENKKLSSGLSRVPGVKTRLVDISL